MVAGHGLDQHSDQGFAARFAFAPGESPAGLNARFARNPPFLPGRTGETSYDNIPFGSDSCPPAERWDGRLLDSGHLRIEHPACVCPALALLGGVTFLSGDGRVFLSRDDKRRLCCHGVPHESQ